MVDHCTYLLDGVARRLSYQNFISLILHFHHEKPYLLYTKDQQNHQNLLGISSLLQEKVRFLLNAQEDTQKSNGQKEKQGKEKVEEKSDKTDDLEFTSDEINFLCKELFLYLVTNDDERNYALYFRDFQKYFNDRDFQSNLFILSVFFLPRRKNALTPILSELITFYNQSIMTGAYFCQGHYKNSVYWMRLEMIQAFGNLSPWLSPSSNSSSSYASIKQLLIEGLKDSSFLRKEICRSSYLSLKKLGENPDEIMISYLESMLTFLKTTPVNQLRHDLSVLALCTFLRNFVNYYLYRRLPYDLLVNIMNELLVNSSWIPMKKIIIIYEHFPKNYLENEIYYLMFRAFYDEKMLTIKTCFLQIISYFFKKLSFTFQYELLLFLFHYKYQSAEGRSRIRPVLNENGEVADPTRGIIIERDADDYLLPPCSLHLAFAPTSSKKYSFPDLPKVIINSFLLSKSKQNPFNMLVGNIQFEVYAQLDYAFLSTTFFSPSGVTNASPSEMYYRSVAQQQVSSLKILESYFSMKRFNKEKMVFPLLLSLRKDSLDVHQIFRFLMSNFLKSIEDHAGNVSSIYPSEGMNYESKSIAYLLVALMRNLNDEELAELKQHQPFPNLSPAIDSNLQQFALPTDELDKRESFVSNYLQGLECGKYITTYQVSKDVFNSINSLPISALKRVFPLHGLSGRKRDSCVQILKWFTVEERFDGFSNILNSETFVSEDGPILKFLFWAYFEEFIPKSNFPLNLLGQQDTIQASTLSQWNKLVQTFHSSYYIMKRFPVASLELLLTQLSEELLVDGLMYFYLMIMMVSVDSTVKRDIVRNFSVNSFISGQVSELKSSSINTPIFLKKLDFLNQISEVLKRISIFRNHSEYQDQSFLFSLFEYILRIPGVEREGILTYVLCLVDEIRESVFSHLLTFHIETRCMNAFQEENLTIIGTYQKAFSLLTEFLDVTVKSNYYFSEDTFLNLFQKFEFISKFHEDILGNIEIDPNLPISKSLPFQKIRFAITLAQLVLPSKSLSLAVETILDKLGQYLLPLLKYCQNLEKNQKPFLHCFHLLFILVRCQPEKFMDQFVEIFLKVKDSDVLRSSVFPVFFHLLFETRDYRLLDVAERLSGQGLDELKSSGNIFFSDLEKVKLFFFPESPDFTTNSWLEKSVDQFPVLKQYPILPCFPKLFDACVQRIVQISKENRPKNSFDITNSLFKFLNFSRRSKPISQDFPIALHMVFPCMEYFDNICPFSHETEEYMINQLLTRSDSALSKYYSADYLPLINYSFEVYQKDILILFDSLLSTIGEYSFQGKIHFGQSRIRLLEKLSNKLLLVDLFQCQVSESEDSILTMRRQITFLKFILSYISRWVKSSMKIKSLFNSSLYIYLYEKIFYEKFLLKCLNHQIEHELYQILVYLYDYTYQRTHNFPFPDPQFENSPKKKEDPVVCQREYQSELQSSHSHSSFSDGTYKDLAEAEVHFLQSLLIQKHIQPLLMENSHPSNEEINTACYIVNEIMEFLPEAPGHYDICRNYYQIFVLFYQKYQKNFLHSQKPFFRVELLAKFEAQYYDFSLSFHDAHDNGKEDNLIEDNPQMNSYKYLAKCSLSNSEYDVIFHKATMVEFSLFEIIIDHEIIQSWKKFEETSHSPSNQYQEELKNKLTLYMDYLKK